MFSGEADIQAKRKILTVIQDQAQRVMDGARELPQLYLSLLKNDKASTQDSMMRIRKVEDDVEGLRRGLTRELAETGALLMNREDVLRAAYSIEQLAAYLSGISFRLSELRSNVLKHQVFGDEMRELLDLSVEIVHQLNEVLRALTINPASTLNQANNVQKTEREIDDKYRILTVKAMKEIKSFSDLILLKDIIERLENLADTCLLAADSVTILALGL